MKDKRNRFYDSSRDALIKLSVISIIYSFIGLLHDSAVMGNMIMKIIGIFMVSIPVLFVAGDSRIAKREENG